MKYNLVINMNSLFHFNVGSVANTDRWLAESLQLQFGLPSPFSSSTILMKYVYLKSQRIPSSQLMSAALLFILKLKLYVALCLKGRYLSFCDMFSPRCDSGNDSWMKYSKSIFSMEYYKSFFSSLHAAADRLHC